MGFVFPIAISSGAMFMIAVGSMFPAVLIVAMVVKWFEIRKAMHWPSVPGKVIASRVDSRRRRPGDFAYNSSDTEMTNEALVQYEYQVGNKTYRCDRLTIGDNIGHSELETYLNRYPVGAEVTVYYDPAQPDKAVLERDLPAMVWWAMGCLVLFFIVAPLVAWLAYGNALDWLRPRLADPNRAPFVAAAGGFALLVALFALGMTGVVIQTCRWPTVPGKIITSVAESFIHVDRQDGGSSRRTHFKPNVQYEYHVKGRRYVGDRINLGISVSATSGSFASRAAARYPFGKEVTVYYDPRKPGDSVLRPWSFVHLLPWLVAAGMFWLAWAVATGRL